MDLQGESGGDPDRPELCELEPAGSGVAPAAPESCGESGGDPDRPVGGLGALGALEAEGDEVGDNPEGLGALGVLEEDEVSDNPEAPGGLGPLSASEGSPVVLVSDDEDGDVPDLHGDDEMEIERLRH